MIARISSSPLKLFLLNETSKPSSSNSPKILLYLKVPGEPDKQVGKKCSPSPPTITRPRLIRTSPFAPNWIFSRIPIKPSAL